MNEQGKTVKLLLTLAAFVIVVAGMKASQELLVPFLLALFIAVIGASPMLWLQRKGLPVWLALTLVVTAFLLVGVLLAGLVGNAITDFSQNLPLYQERLSTRFAGLLTWLSGFGLDADTLRLSEVFNPGAAMSLVGGILNGLGSALTNGFLILLTVIFMLLEAAGFHDKLRYVSGHCDITIGNLGKFTENVRRYIGIKSWISLATGALVYAGLLIIGVDYPLLWGVVAFVLNFVPNIGSFIAGVPVVLLALIQLGPLQALLTMVLYVMVNVVMGNVIEPRFMGRGLGLSTLVVFLSLIFWGWALGPVGMLLSVPLTITAKIALDTQAETRWIAVLLGPDITRIEPEAAEVSDGEESRA